MKRRGLNLASVPVNNEARFEDEEMRSPRQMYDDPPPRKPAYPDEGGEDFDPTDPKQKPPGYDGYSRDAQREAEAIRDKVPHDQAGSAMMEWRHKWMARAKQAGLTDIQASHALDMIQDSL